MTPDEIRHRAASAAREEIFFGVTYDDSGDNTDYETVTKAAIAAYEAAMWQPIETAPKDGTPILIACAQTQSMRWAVWSGHCWRDGQQDAGGRWSGCPNPTHWRPLPTPPGDAP